MRTIVHLSDLHFGRVDATLLDPLVEAVEALAPDVVVVSGDLTQRARAGQFREARDFLARLPSPQIVVPGNHDVPLYNVAARFLSPLRNYRKYIGENLQPCHIDDEIAVCGVNTARSLTFKNGRINCDQLAHIRNTLYPLPAHVLRVVVTHHPFDVGEGVHEDNLLGRASMAMHILSEVGVDLMLSGHLHASAATSTEARYKLDGYSALVVQAGTATSTRGRGEPNAFNVLRVTADTIAVERQAWDSARGAFIAAAAETYQRAGERWAAARVVQPAGLATGDTPATRAAASEPLVIPVRPAREAPRPSA
jgi:3',5'-cyclic AMP phosphodiesterase CpdA